MTHTPKNEREQIAEQVLNLFDFIAVNNDEMARKIGGDILINVLCDFRRMTAAQERTAAALEKISTLPAHTEIFGIPNNAPFPPGSNKEEQELLTALRRGKARVTLLT